MKKRMMLLIIGFLVAPCAVVGDDLLKNPHTTTLPSPTLSPNDALKAAQIQTGTKIIFGSSNKFQQQVDFTRSKLPFWDVIRICAEATDSQIWVRGNSIEFHSAKSKQIFDVSGPFFIAPQQLNSKIDYETQISTHQMTVQVAWPASLPVFRSDSHANVKICTTYDDAGVSINPQLKTNRLDTRNPVSGIATTFVIQFTNLPRTAMGINLKGEITMTMADRFLLFQIDGKSGSGQKLLEGVTVSLTGKTSGNDYLITAQLIYPKTSAKWESYESYWMRSNRLQLVPTGQKTPLQADNFQIGDDNITYLFRGGAKVLSQGWNATYQTPATMREVAIPFELSGVPLPK